MRGSTRSLIPGALTTSMLGAVVGGPGAVAAPALPAPGERGHRVWQRRRQYAEERERRLAFVNVDGSSSAPSLTTRSSETPVDIEQSGALAPDAKIVVYQPPNGGGTGFVGAYFGVVTQKAVRSISSTWGSRETAVINGIKNGFISPGIPQAFTEAYMEGAAQSISMFAASDDAGAYAASRATGGPTKLNAEIYQFAAGSSSPFQPLDTTGTSNDNLCYTGTAAVLQSGERAQSPTWRCWQKTFRRRGDTRIGRTIPAEHRIQ